MAGAEYTTVADRADLREAGRLVVTAGGHSIALFDHEGEIYAVDNRCPHMGFPLAEGTVDDGLLTCHWHHARFELACGDTFDVWADDVQTYPVRVEDGTVMLNPDPEPDVPPVTHWRNRLVDGLAEDLPLVIAKAVIHLDDCGEGVTTPLETTLDFGLTYRRSGWGAGLTVLSAMANLSEHVSQDDQLRALYIGASEVAGDTAGEPPRFDQYALANDDIQTARLERWFRESCEVRDADGAERCLRTAAATHSPADVVEMLLAAATDHLYLDAGHTLDFVNKACELLDRVGWERAPDVLAATIERFTDADRAEERSEWRRPVDVAEYVFDSHDALSALVAAGAGSTWERPSDFIDTLLGDDPARIFEACRQAVRNGATAGQLTDAVADAATRRVAQFGISNEFSDWNTVHHTFTYATAAHELARRTNATVAYRPAFDGVASVYLDRFLTQPPAPLPEVASSDRDPATIRRELLSMFDEQGRVNQAGTLVAEHAAAGGDRAALVATLGEGLLREEPQFHTLQNVEASVRRAERTDSTLPLIATARYMAAHFPTRRSAEQTFDTARRLFRGEQLHE